MIIFQYFFIVYTAVYIFQYKIAELGAHFKEMLIRFAECTDSRKIFEDLFLK